MSAASLAGCLVDPAFERDLEDGDPASAVRLAAGSLTPRRRSVSASAAASDASLISSRSCSSGVRGDDGLALPGVVAALLEQGAGGLEAAATASIGAAESGALATVLTRSSCSARAREQDLALVGEVPEERSLGQPGPLGDLRHRGLSNPRSP
jgi:hypothetical protein